MSATLRRVPTFLISPINFTPHAQRPQSIPPPAGFLAMSPSHFGHSTILNALQQAHQRISETFLGLSYYSEDNRNNSKSMQVSYLTHQLDFQVHRAQSIPPSTFFLPHPLFFAATPSAIFTTGQSTDVPIACL